MLQWMQTISLITFTPSPLLRRQEQKGSLTWIHGLDPFQPNSGAGAPVNCCAEIDASLLNAPLASSLRSTMNPMMNLQQICGRL